MASKKHLLAVSVALLLLATGVYLALERHAVDAMVIGLPEGASKQIFCPGQTVNLLQFDLPRRIRIAGKGYEIALLALREQPPHATLHINGQSAEPLAVGESLLIDYDTILLFRGVSDTAEGKIGSFCVLPN